jgi:nucleoporin SEH1
LKFATGCVNGIVYIYEAINRMELTDWIKSHEIEFEKSSSFSEVGVTCLDWCPGRSEPPTLVIGGRSGNLEIYRCSDASSTYTHFIKLDSRNASPTPQPSMVQGILDVSWSPDVGRSFHLIASCGRDGELRVYRLKKKPAKDESGSDSPSMNTLELEPSQKLDTHGCTMWRCGWNVTGTVLASSGDGGNVLLHKSDWQNVWKLVSRVDQGMGP